jgi:hypothetical protein
MRSRNGKGAKVLQGICRHRQNSTTSQILQPAKFGGWWSKGRTTKFCQTMQKLGWTKEKGKAPRRGGKNLPPSKFVSKTKNYKNVKMIINYGG